MNILAGKKDDLKNYKAFRIDCLRTMSHMWTAIRYLGFSTRWCKNFEYVFASQIRKKTTSTRMS